MRSSCIVDGTFVDMLTAISSGDWAMLGMCCLAFIPDAKAVEGFKAVGGFGKASYQMHSSFGRPHPSLFFAIKEVRDSNSLLAFEEYSSHV